jgi:monoamine oxidase
VKHSDRHEEHPIVIIGAGAAGLAAAQQLRKAGFDPLVLEARNRIGGRIWTDRSRAPVEFGAEFIHGEYATTWELVRAGQIEVQEWSGPRHYALNGQRLPDEQDTALKDRTSELFEAVERYTGPDISVDQVLAASSQPGEAAIGYTQRWFANLEGADTSLLSASQLANEHRLTSAGPTNFRFVNGYDQIVHALADGLEIRLNNPVEQIDWSEQGATLTLAKGKQIVAKKLLITVPIGVLQTGRPHFAPALPAEKQQAIQAIPMGHVTKVILWFKQSFWEPFGYLSTDGKVATWWPSGTAAQPALTGYTGGPKALALDALDESEAVALSLGEIVSLFGHRARELFLGGQRVSWSKDPWSEGAYTYSQVGMGDARAMLAAPIADTLFFAGEATLTNGHLATVHGAIESGRRAADEILAALHSST